MSLYLSEVNKSGEIINPELHSQTKHQHKVFYTPRAKRDSITGYEINTTQDEKVLIQAEAQQFQKLVIYGATSVVMDDMTHEDIDKVLSGLGSDLIKKIFSNQDIQFPVDQNGYIKLPTGNGDTYATGFKSLDELRESLMHNIGGCILYAVLFDVPLIPGTQEGEDGELYHHLNIQGMEDKLYGDTAGSKVALCSNYVRDRNSVVSELSQLQKNIEYSEVHSHLLDDVSDSREQPESMLQYEYNTEHIAKVRAERKKKMKNYETATPIKDKKGYLQPRPGLADPIEIEDEYTDKKDLFFKLQNMSATEVEPNFPPYYYGETYTDENGKEQPVQTYIIIGDFHADEYGLDSDHAKKMGYGKRFLVEDNNEGFEAEVEALRILKNKFGIEAFGLENEVANWFPGTLIAQNASDENIHWEGLEDVFPLFETNMAIHQYIVNTLNTFSLLGVNLENTYPLLTSDEYKQLLDKYSHINHALIANDMQCIIDNLCNYDNDTKEYISKLESLNQAELIEYYRISIQELGPEVQSMMRYIYDSSKENFATDMPGVISRININKKSIDDVVIKERNTRGIKNMDKALNPSRSILEILKGHPKKKHDIGAMVYGKAHIPDLIKQLKERAPKDNDGNPMVNIYVAK